MGCGNEISDWDDKAVQDSLAGKNTGPDPKILEETRAEVERAIEERIDKMMEEKNAEFVEKAEEIIEKGGSGLSERPEIMEEARKEIENLAQPVRTTPEERRVMREAGEELGLSPARYVGTADIVRFPTKENVKEVMAILNHPEMPRIFTRRESIGQVQYIDRLDLYAKTGIGAVTRTTDPEKMREEMLRKEMLGEEIKEEDFPREKTLGIFILPDEKGNVPTGKPLVERITHDIVHGNWPMIREYIQERKTEFDRVIAEQIEKRGLPSYPNRELTRITERMIKAERGELPPLTNKEKGYIKERVAKETIGEISKYYFTDRAQLLPETQRWFGDMLKYFRGG